MKAVILLTLLFLAAATAAQAQTGELFISEYVEGSSDNKALEIFNGTADAIDVGDYQLLRYSNGSSTATTIVLNSHILLPDEVFVLTHEFADPALLSLADQTSNELNFNGNDALVLRRGIHVIDSFGQVGTDPGTAWGCNDGTTVNQTLRRLSSVCTGDTQIDDAFDPCDEFEFYSMDTFSGLGEHTADCQSVGTGHMGWDALKAQYR